VPADTLSIVLGAATFLSAGTAFLTWWNARGSAHHKQLDDQIDGRLAPFDKRVELLEAQFKAAQEASQALIADAIRRELGPVSGKLDVLEAKMDVFWRQVAVDAAKILHQPNPERRYLDSLLDAFTESLDAQVPMAPDKEVALRKELVRIRNWEPGDDLGYPVRDGEQTAAAILLRTMSHVVEPQGKHV
jgi:hypothetical protein